MSTNTLLAILGPLLTILITGVTIVAARSRLGGSDHTKLENHERDILNLNRVQSDQLAVTATANQRQDAIEKWLEDLEARMRKSEAWRQRRDGIEQERADRSRRKP